MLHGLKGYFTPLSGPRQARGWGVAPGGAFLVHTSVLLSGEGQTATHQVFLFPRAMKPAPRCPAEENQSHAYRGTSGSGGSWDARRSWRAL